ncbi:MAG: hypothetical protein JXA03_04120 [Bacteroidales bacterium]|nr:hypothetical protein [Bacteroidales bacterium]
MKRQMFFRSFLLLFLVFVLLLTYQEVWDSLSARDLGLRNFAFFVDWLKPDTSGAAQGADSTTLIPEEAAIDTVSPTSGTDTVMLSAGNDTLSPVSGLKYFFSALSDLKNGRRKQVRIAWFGDSMIEGDLIVMTFRNEMQKTYGGQGVGFVPVTSPVAGFRITVKHSFSEAWKSWNIIQHKDSPFPFGLTCTAYTADTSVEGDRAWVTYSGGNAFQRTFTFPQGSLFFGKRPETRDSLSTYSPEDTATVQVWTGDSLIREIPLITDHILNRIELFNTPLKEVTLQIGCDTSLPFYGVDLGGPTGVNVDNFAFRGNSGYGLMSVENEMLCAFRDLMQYDLIVMQYGTNVMSPGTMDYGWYGNAMNFVYGKLKKTFTRSSILVISVGDRAIRENLDMVTDPGIPILLEIQKKSALENGLAFFNLFEAMGGAGSMKNWVEKEEPWANPDYTHLNFKGAREIAGLIYNYLHAEYNKYLTSPENSNHITDSNHGGTTE